jgi:hypothetical protein
VVLPKTSVKHKSVKLPFWSDEEEKAAERSWNPVPVSTIRLGDREAWQASLVPEKRLPQRKAVLAEWRMHFSPSFSG